MSTSNACWYSVYRLCRISTCIIRLYKCIVLIALLNIWTVHECYAPQRFITHDSDAASVLGWYCWTLMCFIVPLWYMLSTGILAYDIQPCINKPWLFLVQNKCTIFALSTLHFDLNFCINRLATELSILRLYKCWTWIGKGLCWCVFHWSPNAIF